MNGLPPVDIVVVLALLWIAWRVLVTPYLFNAVVLFIVFGLLMALAWVRLAAPDIALAEAAIGAGVTGVLLLDALAHLEVGQRQKARQSIGWVRWGVITALVLFLSGGLLRAIMLLPAVDLRLHAQVEAAIPNSGVTHAVTAVLLNFRGYDTLLEIAVLVVAVLGVLSLYRVERVAAEQPTRNPVLQTLAAVVVPIIVLVAGYLLWSGSHQPGGAFQAGAVLGAGGVLLRLTGRLPAVGDPSFGWRIGLAIGLSVFVGVAAGMMVNGALLQYPREWASALILLVEAALTVSIGFTLFVLFAGAPTGAASARAP